MACYLLIIAFPIVLRTGYEGRQGGGQVPVPPMMSLLSHSQSIMADAERKDTMDVYTRLYDGFIPAGGESNPRCFTPTRVCDGHGPKLGKR